MTIAEAIKANADPHHNAMDTRDILHTLAAQGIMFGTDIGAGLGGRALTRGMMHGGMPISLVKKPMEMNVEDLARGAGLDIKTNMIPGSPNASFLPRLVALLQGRNTGAHGAVNLHGRGIRSMPIDIAAHEIGHALAWNNKAGPVAGAVAKGRIPAQIAMFLAPLVGGTIATTGTKTLADRDKWFDRTSVASGLAAGVVGVDEAIASRNALKVLHKLPIGMRLRALESASPRLLRAWGTYGLSGLGLVLGPQLAKQYYHRTK